MKKCLLVVGLLFVNNSKHFEKSVFGKHGYVEYLKAMWIFMSEPRVSWLPWGKRAFDKAKMLDKPILLDISAVWCHWCHVMDETTYSDAEVAGLIEKETVPVRVDRDQRPDIDKRYNMGGWPSVAFLTPDGEVITGGTYIPPGQMKELLQQIGDFYRQNKGEIKAKLKELSMQEAKEPEMKYGLDEEFYRSIIDHLTLAVASNFDTVHGGFGTAPKFPHSDVLSFSLMEYKLQGQKALLNIVTKTLEKMSEGGIYDQEEGGFFRYSTTMDWSVPHYEKMCEDNAELLMNYLEAYQVTQNEGLRQTAEGILSYVEANLCEHENGGFYGSQDADEEYYKLSLPERRKRAPPQVDKTLYTNYNAMMISAYLSASVVLDKPFCLDFALKTVDFLMSHAFSSKRGMHHFYFNGKKRLPGLLSDQVHMMKCLINAYQTSGERRFLNDVEEIAQFVTNNLWDNAGGFYDRPKRVENLGALTNQMKPFDENSVAADAFLRLHYLTGKQGYEELGKKTLDYFASNYQKYDIMAAGYGLAVEFHMRPMQIHIVGIKNDPATRRFLDESLKVYNPLKTIEVLSPEIDSKRLTVLKYRFSETPKSYICHRGACRLVESPEQMAARIEFEQS